MTMSRLRRRRVRTRTQAEIESAVWLSIREASAYTTLSVKVLYAAVQRGALEAVRVDGRRRLVFKRLWLDAYLERLSVNHPVDLREWRQGASNTK